MGKLVKILLIGELAVFDAGKAPFQTAFQPPTQAGAAAIVISKRQPADVVDAITLLPPALAFVVNDADGAICKLVEQRFRLEWK